jgi:hypothetical protein
MQRGDEVTIYIDPVTQNSVEGRAKLRREIRPDEGDGLAMWEVKFLDDGYIALRTIKVSEGEVTA